MEAQENLLNKRRHLFGRLAAMRLLGVPTPRLRGFALWKNWRDLPAGDKVRSVAGTVRRVLQRGLWRRRPLPDSTVEGPPAPGAPETEKP